MIGKLWNESVAIIIFIFVFFFAGCGSREVQDGMRCTEEEAQKLIWYEKHMTQEGECSILAVTEDMTYGCYYGKCRGNGNWMLTCVLSYKGNRIGEKGVLLPEGWEVRDVRIDKNGNVHVQCGQ